MFTAHQSKLWAAILTARGEAESVGRLSRALGNARVDLNPHQVDAALFASGASAGRGVILADEVGLGKTIEAALVLAQRWAERRRRLLVVAPASLRKQWAIELQEKFYLPSVVLETAEWNRLRTAGKNPFDTGDGDARVVICSYQFAARQASSLRPVPWDLVVIDEAHRLRNVEIGEAKVARAIRDALVGRPKVLLTATPLQNSLLELFGLVSVVDPHVFGDELSFRAQFLKSTETSATQQALRDRLVPICRRTLRRQVLEYVRFTQRVPILHEFTPTSAEQLLYDAVSEYLRRKELHALPQGQRALMTMVLRKLLASSTFAIGATLAKLRERLEAVSCVNTDDLCGDMDVVPELVDEWGDAETGETKPPAAQSLRREIADLTDFIAQADAIKDNAKGLALVSALASGMARAQALGAAAKAVIFTESRRTQAYLFQLLEQNGYPGRVVQLNGQNSDAGSKAIYQAWRTRHQSDGVATGVRAVDVKAAVVEAFRDEAQILLATESAAEGINLQFCSLLVNYDLPWNPQRIEQRSR